MKTLRYIYSIYTFVSMYGMYYVCSMYYAYDNFFEYIYRITYNYCFGINVINREDDRTERKRRN